eukprot:c34708_g1_i1 orf=41-220(+)
MQEKILKESLLTLIAKIYLLDGLERPGKIYSSLPARVLASNQYHPQLSKNTRLDCPLAK